MLRAVLFDFNGVLVDDERIHFELFRELFAEEHALELGEDEYFEHLVGLDDRGAFATLLADRSVPDPRAEADRLLAAKAERYRETMSEHGYPFFPGAAELVRSTAAAGLGVGIVSGALRAEVEGALRQAGLDGLVGLVVAAEDVPRSKPAPDGYRAGIAGLRRRIGRDLAAAEVLAIEDTFAGLEAARGAGLLTLGVAHTHPAAELEPLADRVVAEVGSVTVELARSIGAESDGDRRQRIG